ncbi:MAG: hypothetical protein IJD03_04310 [Clostridia bacterium]|nr:hypothetical protein [Clostridia bacterium]MBQ3062862.1 hypothetical protein [Clostridia bacterium]
MRSVNDMVEFLEKLEENNIYFTLSKIRDSVLVTVAVPGERWEIEFMASGEIEIEKFKSNGEIYGEEELKLLFESF